jgi:hypothetical protein
MARTKPPSTGWGIPLPREREFEEISMVEVLIERMYGWDGSRPLDYERAGVVKAEKKDSQGSGRKDSFEWLEKSVQRVFDRADIERCPAFSWKESGQILGIHSAVG